MHNFDPKSISETPGVYLMKNSAGRVIYVGKARHLRRRVSSYFRPEAGLSPKTRAMVRQVDSIETISTATEQEALLLEATLIKKHRPRYNILLKDDKQYVLFRLSRQERYPALTLTRKVLRDGAVYFGPFSSAQAARQAWKAIQAAFPLRRCSDQTFKNRVRPCLYHYMNQCPAPCVLDVAPEDYAAMVRQVELLLRGKSGELVRQMEAAMRRASEDMNFEEAAVLRDRIKAVRAIVEHQSVVTDKEEDLDALGFCFSQAGLTLSLIFVRAGRLLGKKSFFWAGLEPGDMVDTLAAFLAQYYDQYRYLPDRILLPDPVWHPELPAGLDLPEQIGAAELAATFTARRGQTVRLALPRGRVERGLAEIARTNAREESRQNQDQLPRPDLAQVFGLAEEPVRIEAVDVAHISGQDTRLGMVVFENGEPLKDQYRLYSFPELEEQGLGNDDYAVLTVWTGRRLKAGPPWPDLLLVDGGKGQLSAIGRVLDEHGRPWPWAMAGIAKARRESEAPEDDLMGARRVDRRAGALDDQIFVPGRKNPLNLKPGSTELLFLQNIRDQVHRYATTRHRRAHRKSALSGALINLPGVGPKTAQTLWSHFQSLEAMAAAPEDALQKLLPHHGLVRIRSLKEKLAELTGL